MFPVSAHTQHLLRRKQLFTRNKKRMFLNFFQKHFIPSTNVACARKREKRISQGFWGTREHGQFQLGNRGTKAKYLREQGNKKRFREHGNKALLNGRTKNWKKNATGTYLATFSLHPRCQHFFFQSICMESRQRLNWGISMCYKSTLANWMLGKIVKNLVGNRNSEITVTTHYPGADLKVVRSNPLN